MGQEKILLKKGTFKECVNNKLPEDPLSVAYEEILSATQNTA